VISRYAGTGFQFVGATRAVVVVVAAEGIVDHRQDPQWAAVASAALPKGLKAVARGCSGTASAAGCIAVVMVLVETSASSGNSAQWAAAAEPETRTDSSYRSVAPRSLIVEEALSEAEVQ
jgi:hypothetical protein